MCHENRACWLIDIRCPGGTFFAGRGNVMDKVEYYSKEWRKAREARKHKLYPKRKKIIASIPCKMYIDFVVTEFKNFDPQGMKAHAIAEKLRR